MSGIVLSDIAWILGVGAWPFISNWLGEQLQVQLDTRKMVAGDWNSGTGKSWKVNALLLTVIGLAIVFCILLTQTNWSRALAACTPAIPGMLIVLNNFWNGPGEPEKRILRKSILAAYATLKKKARAEEVDRFLGHYLGTETDRVAGQVVWALGDWGSPEAFRMLSHFPRTQATNPALTSIWLLGKDKYEVLEGQFSKTDSISEFLNLVRDHHYWQRMGNQGIFHPDFKEQFPYLYQFVSAQEKLRKKPEQVYCTRDRRWAKEEEFKGWRYLTCPVCEKTDAMETEVQTVTGIVGPRSIELGRENGELKLGLWLEGEEKAYPADINMLEVRAGAEFNYDWAIAGVLEAQKNHTRRSFKVKVAPEVELSTNTQRMLQELSAE